MKSFLLGSALWACTLAGGVALAAEEIVINGDFSRPEGGGADVEGWELLTPFSSGKRVPHEDGGYCLSIEAGHDEESATWVQRGIPVDPGVNYRLSYRAKADPGEQYRGYIEYWNVGRTSAYPQGAQWHTGNGEWQEHQINFTYQDGMTPPYIALNAKAGSKALFSHITLVNLDSEAQATVNEAFGLNRWKLDAQARLIEEGSDGRVIELRSDQESLPASISLPKISLVPGKRYRLSYEVKSIPGTASSSTGFQHFRVSTGGESGKPQEGGEWQDCFEAWTTRHLEFSLADDTAGQASFTAELRAPGAMVMRNFRLETTEAEVAAPFTMRLTNPSYRNILYGEAKEISGEVTLTSSDVISVEVVLSQNDQELGRQTIAAPSFNASKSSAPLTFRFDAKNLTEGEATLQVNALGTKESIAKDHLSLLKVPPRSPSVLVGDDLVLRQDGKPFFPIVLWHPPASHRQMHDLHQAGFNTIVSRLRSSLLDTAARYHMKIIGDLNSPRLVARENDPALLEELAPKLRETVDLYSRHPALLAWYIADEPLWVGIPLPPLRWTYSQLRKIDPYHPVWINEAPRGSVEDLARYATAADLFGVDIYPVPQGGSHSELDDRSLSSVGKYTDRFHETVAHRKPIWMVLQGFAWLNLHDRTVDGVYPTWEETRFMAYNSLVHGAQGIVYWGTQFINEPTFWDSLLRTSREVADLSAVLVEPTVKETGLSADNPSIAILHKRHGDDDIFLVINESGEAIDAHFELKTVTNRLHVQFEDRSVQVKFGKFGESFKPWDVHVYTTRKELPPPLVETLKDLPSDGPSYQEEARKQKSNASFESKANWLWANEPRSGETVYFRRAFAVKPGLKSATLWITGDDHYDVFLNEKKVGADHGRGPGEEERGGWMTLEGYSLTQALSEGGDHLLAVEVRDAGLLPAGLLVDLRMEYQTGEKETLVSDPTWKVTRSKMPNWTAVALNDSSWDAATVVVPYGGAPWRKDVHPVPVP